MIIDNWDEGEHPIHAHGRRVYVMGRGKENDGPYNATRDTLNLVNPIMRDTVTVAASSWIGEFSSNRAVQPSYSTQSANPIPVSDSYSLETDLNIMKLSVQSVVRFVDRNPGIWMLHCHINWHQVKQCYS